MLLPSSAKIKSGRARGNKIRTEILCMDLTRLGLVKYKQNILGEGEDPIGG